MSGVETQTVDQVDDFHGEAVPDPYRWLEDTNSPATATWIAAQNAVTEAWLEAQPARPAIRARLSEIWDHPTFGVPFERGGRWFQTRNSGLQNQSVLYVADTAAGEGRVLLDPNGLSEEGTVAVTAFEVSHDGRLLAYATSSAGSDWKTWRVRDVETGVDRDDVIEWAKFSSASWRRDGSGFYYSAPEPPEPGREHLGETALLRVLFHRLGAPAADDIVVFMAPDEPEWVPTATVTEDGRFLVVVVQKGTAPESRLHVVDLEEPGAVTHPITTDFGCQVDVVANVGRTFYLVTDDRAERRRLVAADLDRPGREHWRELVPERAAVLLTARHCGGRLVCLHLEHACARLSVVGLDGAFVREVLLPAVASLIGDELTPAIEGRPDSPVVHFGLTSFTDPGSIWSHDVGTAATTEVQRSSIPVAEGSLVSEQVFVTADDGVPIPLFLTRRLDVAPSGDVPVLLNGYGGFNVPITPAFRPAHTVFVERGGLLAVAVLRGGGEYGTAWHDAGRLARKQRVFDDFTDCARWLAASGWSRPDRIAINGGSNGGLLVGACLTQHPELFGAAVPEVGVLDMLRFHRFTIGWAWKSDYGDPEDPEQFGWVRAYSPLHNIVPGREYPPTLVMTGDHDDRVVPGHSFKFAAALQAAQPSASSHPILIRIETSAGHGLGKPTAKAIAERADMLTFVEGAFTIG
jgi:prolyl oligopeptidase